MNYRTYRTLVLIAALLLAGVAATPAVQPQWAKLASADATFFAPPQTMYTRVAFVADNRKYVAAESGGGRELVADRDRLGPWETFNVVHLGNDRLALQASNGKYVSARGGTLLANRDCIGEWETFLMVRVGTTSRIALKANNGKYVCAEGGGGRELVANRDEIGPWEMFWMYPW